MGTKLDNFKSTDEIDYDTVFKNHAVLMGAYRAVLKIGRNKFVESHIYKKLRLLRKIYLVEIATLPDYRHRSTLNELVENTDKFQSDLSYYPDITSKGVISIIVPILTAIAIICSWLREIWSPEVAEGVAEGVGVGVGTYLLLFSLGFYLELFLSLALVSFIDKRLLFIFPGYKLFPEDKLQGRSDKEKKRWKSFLWKEIKGTIYEKEDILFKSLKARKNVEQDVDIVLLEFMSTIIYIIITFALFSEKLFLLAILPSCFFLPLMIFCIYVSVKRKVK